MRILSLYEIAERMSCSRRTIERAIDRGEGPTLTRISERRIGVAEPDYLAWIESRRRPAPSVQPQSAAPAA